MLRRPRTDRPSARRRGPQRVLVVDDNVDSATLIGLVLRRAGYEVAEVGDHHLALAVLQNEGAVDLVLTAFSDAGSGASLKLLDALRSHPDDRLRHMRVAFLSDQGRQLLLAWQAGADAALSRPCHEKDLLEAVDEALQRSETDRLAARQRNIHRLSQPSVLQEAQRTVFS